MLLLQNYFSTRGKEVLGTSLGARDFKQAVDCQFWRRVQVKNYCKNGIESVKKNAASATIEDKA
jgi:hypothetical protein